jgi:hypothetical protein
VTDLGEKSPLASGGVDFKLIHGSVERTQHALEFASRGDWENAAKLFQGDRLIAIILGGSHVTHKSVTVDFGPSFRRAEPDFITWMDPSWVMDLWIHVLQRF